MILTLGVVLAVARGRVATALPRLGAAGVSLLLLIAVAASSGSALPTALPTG